MICRKRVVRVCAAALAAVVVALPATIAGASKDPMALGHRYDGDSPDPEIIRVDNTYFAYSTTTHGRRIPVLRSLDMREWYVAGDALGEVPSWSEDRDFWAPSVRRIGDRFVMYFTAPAAGKAKQCIGVATAASPVGPFLDALDAPLVCESEYRGDVDPFEYTESDGSMWLLWKTEPRSGDKPRIVIQQLLPNGLGVVGTPIELLRMSDSWESPTAEAPTMTLVGGVHVLGYSAGTWTSSKYAIGYAICTTVTGPCAKNPNNPWLASVEWLRGPGGGSFFTDAGGKLQVAYHYWRAPNIGYANNGARRLRITEVVPNVFGLSLGETVSDLPPNRWSLDIASSPSGDGYLIASGNGAVEDLGDAEFEGSVGGFPLNFPVVGVAPTPSGNGYWLAASDGGVFGFGDASFLGGATGKLNKPIVGIAATPTGNGYWLVASDGGIFSFGDALFLGSTGAQKLNEPIVGIAATPSGQGYWLVASDGGVFTFGDAVFHGSTGAQALHKPIVGLTPTADGQGYWFVASDGGVFSFGNAEYFGSAGGLALAAPVSGIAARPDGQGYWLLGLDGAVFAFGDARYLGSAQ